MNGDEIKHAVILLVINVSGISVYFGQKFTSAYCIILLEQAANTTDRKEWSISTFSRTHHNICTNVIIHNKIHDGNGGCRS